MSVLVYLAVLVIFVLVSFRTVRLGLEKLKCSRSFSAPSGFAGEEGAFVETVQNNSPCMLPWLRLEFRTPDGIQVGNQENVYSGAQSHYSSLFTLMPYQQIRRTHHVKFLRRGEYDLGNVTLTAGDLLGLKQFRRKYASAAPVLVYPRLLDSSELPAPVSQMLGDISVRRQLLEDPFLIRGIRAYHPGDPVRDIHWPATAKSGQVQLRVRDHTARSRMLVVLNAQCRENQWKDTIPEEYEPLIERGISMAATVCVHGLKNGLSVGFAANLSQDKSGESTVLLPGTGAEREEELLCALARLKNTCTQPVSVLLDSLNRFRDLDILILSCYASSAIDRSARQLRDLGNQVTVHYLGGETQ